MQYKGSTLLDGEWHAAAAEATLAARGRFLLFDVGATRWKTPGMSDAYSGLQWFWSHYAALDITFDAMYAWELGRAWHTHFFDGMDVHTLASMHFYNLGAPCRRPARGLRVHAPAPRAHLNLNSFARRRDAARHRGESDGGAARGRATRGLCCLQARHRLPRCVRRGKPDGRRSRSHITPSSLRVQRSSGS